jgi:hypothetical protein
MSGRYRQTGGLDESVTLDGDATFRGVDMRRDPALLEPGWCSDALNYEFRHGIAVPRKGWQTRAWARELGADFPLDFPADFALPQGLGEVFGAGLFSDPYGQEYAMLACARVAYAVAANAPPQVIAYPQGVRLNTRVTFCQAFNTLLMFRGAGRSVLQLQTGTNFSAPHEFTEVADETNEDYTSTMPPAARGLHYGNRVWAHYDGNRVAYSDLLAYTRWDADLSEIFVNSGSDDTLQILFPLGDNAILAFKDQSIYAISGVLPSPALTGRLDVISTERGTVAPETVCQVGKDVWFLSHGGIYAVSQALDNRLQAVAEPVSAPIEPLMNRINWAYAAGACATVVNNQYFLAVPLDGATHNNAVLVYDFLNAAWAGYWQMERLDARYVLRLTIEGRRRLAIVNGTAHGAPWDGTLWVLGDGFTDEGWAGSTAPVQTRLVTRGLSADSPAQKRFLEVYADLATWHGAGSVSMSMDGVNEAAERLEFDKVRGKALVWGGADWDPTNANDDHATPRRQDYSVALTPGLSLGSKGIAFGLHQISSERMRVRQCGQWAQVTLHGTRGRVAVRGVRVATAASREELRQVV